MLLSSDKKRGRCLILAEHPRSHLEFEFDKLQGWSIWEGYEHSANSGYPLWMIIIQRFSQDPCLRAKVAIG
jgi:hypothetical protein